MVGFIENKKAWLRIIEAFIAIMMILGVIMVLISRQSSQSSRENEITSLQGQILDYISRNDTLRAEVLSGNTALPKITSFVNRTIPPWIEYRILSCLPNDICNIPLYAQNITQEVYTNEILIVANLTYYQPESARKLKLFFWEK